MFGIGTGGDKAKIEGMVPALADAFSAQMDEIRNRARIPKENWDEWAVVAFSMWTVHLALVNANMSIPKAKKLQEALNDAANQYVFNKIMTNPALVEYTINQKRGLHSQVVKKFLSSSLAYNDAFNRDKVRSFDKSIDDGDVSKNTLDHLIGNVVTSRKFMSNLDNLRPTMTVLVAQLMTTAMNGLSK